MARGVVEVAGADQAQEALHGARRLGPVQGQRDRPGAGLQRRPPRCRWCGAVVTVGTGAGLAAGSSGVGRERAGRRGPPRRRRGGRGGGRGLLGAAARRCRRRRRRGRAARTRPPTTTTTADRRDQRDPLPALGPLGPALLLALELALRRLTPHLVGRHRTLPSSPQAAVSSRPESRRSQGRITIIPERTSEGRLRWSGARRRISGRFVPDQLLRGGHRTRGRRASWSTPARTPSSPSRRCSPSTGSPRWRCCSPTGTSTTPSASRPVCDGHDVPAWIHPEDRAMLADPLKGLSARGARRSSAGRLELREPREVRELDDGAALELAGLTPARRPHPGPHPGLGRVQHAHRRGRRGDPRRATRCSPGRSGAPTCPAATPSR